MKLKKLKTTWFIFSIAYLCLVIFDFIVIYPNERERPERDRLFATIELIEYSFKLQRLKSIEQTVNQMIENDSPGWRVFAYFAESCKAIEPSVKILKSDKAIQAKFIDQTLLEYDAETSFINLTDKNIPSKNFFTGFPNLIDLHIIYKKIDYDAKVLELHDNFKDLDFSSIEDKYIKSLVWILPRFVFFGFIIWFFPVSIGLLIIISISRRR